MIRVLQGDCRDVLATLPDASVQTCVTSPPYWGLRSYLPDGHIDKGKEIGLEQSPDAYVAEMVAVFREVRRVLRHDGSVFLNLGDSYAATGGPGAGGNAARMGRAYQQRNVRPNGRHDGIKPKDLIGIPWMVAFALRADGWWLRSDIIWHKPNPMPESVTDRPTSAHEHVFLFSKQERYFYDADAVREPCSDHPVTAARNNRADKGIVGAAALHGSGWGQSGNGGFERAAVAARNIRNVWTIATQPYAEAHFATFPPELAERCIKAGSKAGDTILDPFGGAGTTGLVADRLGRNAVLIELNPEYAEMARRRVQKDGGMFAEVA